MTDRHLEMVSCVDCWEKEPGTFNLLNNPVRAEAQRVTAACPSSAADGNLTEGSSICVRVR